MKTNSGPHGADSAARVEPEDKVKPVDAVRLEHAGVSNASELSDNSGSAHGSKKERNELSLRAIGRWFRVRPMLTVGTLAVACAALYWGIIASDRFVSEAHLVVDRTDIQSGASFDLASVLTGGGYSTTDLRLLRDHLRSVDMLVKLQRDLKIKEHFSDRSHDFLSRLSADAPQEVFHDYYLDRISIEIDDQVGVLRVIVQAYDARMAQSIARALLAEGEAFMNDMGHKLAQTQVTFLERQVDESGRRQREARQALLTFQNKTGLISPEAQADALASITARLEGELTTLRAQRSAMLGYLSPQAPDVIQNGMQIDALEKQLKAEQTRLAAPGRGGDSALNRRVEEYQRLEMEAKFTQQVYETSMLSLERGRVEALRTLKKLSVLQQPTLAEESVQPRRMYNLLIFTLTIVAIAIIAQLLAAVVRDHRD